LALTDYLKALVGVGNSDPNAVQPRDIYTPGVESFLSAIPSLIGAYAAGKPGGGGMHAMGRPLEMLGQLGMTNAANRQAQQQGEGDIAGRLQSLASRGLSPNMDTQDALARMTPKAANEELSDVAAQQLAEQKKTQVTHLPNMKWDKMGRAWINDPKTAQPTRYSQADIQGGGKGNIKETGMISALAELGIDPNGPITPEQALAARRQMVQDKQRLSMASKMGSMQGTVEMIPRTPLGIIAKGAGVYIPNKDGSYTPINGIIDPRASYGDYNAGKTVTVAPNEVIPFNQNQSAVKGLQQLKKVINSPDVKDKYIPRKPGARSFMGDPLREFVAMVDPSAAAAPVITATVVAEAMAKGLTNRTIQAQLKLLREGIMNGHGTIDSTDKAIDAATTLLQQSANTMIQRGAGYTSKGAEAAFVGAEPPPAVAEPPAESDDDFEDR
jgi:hypothetical protein